MTNRCQIEFYDAKRLTKTREITACIYQHTGGDPKEALEKIKKAVDLAEKSYKEEPGYAYRIPIAKVYKDDPWYYMSDLAAFYILANKMGAGEIEIENELHGDLDYIYQLFPSPSGLKCRIVDLIKKRKAIKEATEEGTLKSMLKKYS